MSSEESNAEDFEVSEPSFSSQNENSNNDLKLTYLRLAEIIASNDVNVKELAEDWVVFFNNHAPRALDTLLCLVLESGGYKKTNLQSDNEEPRIFITSVGYQEMLSAFFKHLMTLQVIRHNSIMERLKVLLIKLSSSKYKSYRITAVVIANQLISSLLEAKMIVSSGNQSNSETDEENSQQNKEQDYIDSHLSNLLSQIIRFRIRDIESEIRMSIIYALLKWIIEYPDEMAIDKYLKYINLFLCDSNASIRLVAVKGIIQIVSAINDIRKLYNFMRECVPKLVFRISDVNSKVAAAAIKAIDFIDRCFKKIVPDAIYEEIFIEVYSNDEKKRQAAGRFLVRQLGEEDNEASSLIDIIQFQLESPVQDYGEYLISSVFKKIPSLTDWEKWIRCLSNETDENKQVTICQLMLHTIRLAATGSYPPWPRNNLIFHPTDELTLDNPNDLLNTSDQQIFSSYQKNITKYFRKILIKLFREYEDQPRILIYFFAIPQYFSCASDLMMMTAIIDELQKFALTSKDITVLNNSLYHVAVILNNVSKEWEEHVTAKRDFLIKNIVYDSFIPTVKKLIASKETEININIEISLERTAVMGKFFNLTDTPLVRLAFEVLDSSIKNLKILEIKIFSNICFQIICWKFNDIIDILEKQDHVSEVDVMTLKVLNQKLLDCAIKILSLNLEERIKSMAFMIICKLLMTFSQRNKKMKKILPAVIYPSKTKLEWLAHHLTTTVPDSFNAGVLPSPEHKYLLTKYCNLLENHIIHSSNVANILPYFQTEDYVKILSRSLHILLRNEISMESTVTTLVYALEVLLQQCQKNEDISEQKLQNILNGICISLHPKYKGLEKAIQAVQVVGLHCIHVTQNRTFFSVLEFFIPLIRKPENVENLKGLIIQYFTHIIDKSVVKSYINSLDQIKEALTQEKHSQTMLSEITDDELSSEALLENVSNTSETSDN